MGLGDKLFDPAYQPKGTDTGQQIVNQYISRGIGDCPVKFTEDPIEYSESTEYLGMKLRPLQRNFIIDLYSLNAQGKPNFTEGVFIAGMRGGKCNRKGTLILMLDGTLRKVEDIKVGEYVMGPDSKPRLVLGTNEGKSELFEVTQSCADTYVVNDAHILSLKKAQSVNCSVEKEKNKKGKKNSYARYPDEPDVVNIPIKEYLEKSNKWKYFFRGYKAGLIKFPYQKVPLDPYFYGMWAGGGSSKAAQITNMDPEIEEYIFNFAKKIGASVRVYQKLGNRAKEYTIRCDNKHGIYVLQTLRNMNVYGNKHIPQCYITNSKEVRLQVLAGLIDSDGYLREEKKIYEITLANKTLAYDVKRLADTLGFCTNIREKKTTCQIEGFKGIAWWLSIYGDGIEEIPCKVKRKQCKLNGKRSNKEFGLSTLKVKSIGVGEYAGIAVDGDHLYCLADGTVTHNSVLAAIIATFQTHKLLAFDNPAKALGQMSGDRLTVQCIASSLDQAEETIYAKVEAIVNSRDPESWWFRYIEWLKRRETSPGGRGPQSLYASFAHSIEFFEKNVAILALHSNSASLAGKTSACCVFDELSRFDVAEGAVQGKSQKKTANAVYNTSARAATSLLPFSKVVTITSPMYEDDYGMQLLLMAGTFKGGAQSGLIDSLRSRIPEKSPMLLGYHCTTFDLNPHVDEAGNEIPGGADEDSGFFRSKRIQDPEAYRRDYLALPPAAVSPFIEYPERILPCIHKNDDPKVLFTDKLLEDAAELDGNFHIRRYAAKEVFVVHPDRMTKYFVCCDQGEKHDHFVVAMGHGEEYERVEQDQEGKEYRIPSHRIIIDFVEGWVPDKQNRITVHFKNVEETIIKLAQSFNIRTVAFDQWNSAESLQSLFAEGIFTEKLGATYEMYDVLKQMIYMNQIEFPDNARLLQELRQLTNIKGDKIDHPSNGCFTGDTKIALLDGTTPTFESLAALGKDHTFWVYAMSKTGEIVPAQARNAHITKYITELCEVTLDSGAVVQCTPEHLFRLKNGEYIEAQNLKEQESLAPLYLQDTVKHYKKGGRGYYKQIYTGTNWAFVHKWVSEYFNFAATTYDEVIHHKDLNSLNNTPENLEKLTRAEHGRRHMQINAKAHTPAAIAKRSATFKTNYWSSPERQAARKANAIAYAKKTIEAQGRAYVYTPKSLSRKTVAERKELCANQLKKIPVQTLRDNAIKVNSNYWQSPEGKLRRATLSNTQLREAAKIAYNNRKEQAFQKLNTYFDSDYIISVRLVKQQCGSTMKFWRSVFPEATIKANLKKLVGMSLEEATLKCRCSKRLLVYTLKQHEMHDEFICFNHKVTRVRKVQLETPIPVYDISVPNYENFALADGIFVHNSKDAADAVCRVCYKIYETYVKAAYHGQFMTPMAQRFPTMRSVATMYDMRNADLMNPAGNPVFGGNWGGNSISRQTSIFEGTIVRPNVVPNVDGS